MSTSDRTFEQVKNILGKLDRNIDAARARRLHDNGPSAGAGRMGAAPHGEPQRVGSVGNGQAAGSGSILIGAPSGSGGAGSPNSAPKPMAPSKSGFGRAKPLRPNGSTQGSPGQS